MLLEVVVDAEQHSFIRVMGIFLWLLMVIFFSPLLPLLTVYPSWSHDTLVLICIALCAVAYAYFLMRLPWTCASRKNWRGRLFNCYRYHSFTNSIKRIDKELELVNKKLEQRKKSDQKQDQNGTVPPYAPASNMEQPLEQRLAVLERQTAALLDVTEKLEASISSTKQKKTLCGLCSCSRRRSRQALVFQPARVNPLTGVAVLHTSVGSCRDDAHAPCRQQSEEPEDGDDGYDDDLVHLILLARGLSFLYATLFTHAPRPISSRGR